MEDNFYLEITCIPPTDFIIATLGLQEQNTYAFNMILEPQPLIQALLISFSKK